ncbi:hypothetical protein CCACVL1_27748 [Corchorus capsularis]|uniref:Uncharacterized protein n=1 Tax=Corchorus capsularis TaxID=210143 RepID=A0A1R3G8Z0_COCAP|nr:hypothetical protein CCACVL1_27748 [Corchorus capsularis]
MEPKKFSSADPSEDSPSLFSISSSGHNLSFLSIFLSFSPLSLSDQRQRQSAGLLHLLASSFLASLVVSVSLPDSQ